MTSDLVKFCKDHKITKLITLGELIEVKIVDGYEGETHIIYHLVQYAVSKRKELNHE